MFDAASLSPSSPWLPGTGEPPPEPQPTACDAAGRIGLGSSPDGRVCAGPDACVSALPADFCEVLRGVGLSPPYCQGSSSAAALAGRPWCVAPQELASFQGPIEVRCKASGPEARKPGSPTGCWWLEAYAKKDLQRFPGLIKVGHMPDRSVSPSVYVQQGDWRPGMAEKKAENWILNGSLGELPFAGRRVAAFIG